VDEVLDFLVVGVAVDGRHEGFFDAEVVGEDFADGARQLVVQLALLRTWCTSGLYASWLSP
jgi:hypothetical protein